jgi:c(7)-type cytochrome triheme protein
LFFPFCAVSFEAQALPNGVQVTYAGKGAGAVTFDGAVHAKAFSCAECHDDRGLMPPLFQMKNFGNGISMRKMEMGQSCGKCHAVSMKDTSSCSLCHRK